MKLNKDNSLLNKVIREVAKELNLSEEIVDRSVKHFFLWQRQMFNSFKYSKYLWNFFGTFTVLDDRYQKLIESDKWKREQGKLEQNKLNNINNKNINHGKKK